MEYSAKLLKPFCDRLAQAALTADGLHLTRMMQMAGILGQQCTFPAENTRYTPEAGDTSGARVGIWERGDAKHGKAFVRRLDLQDEWNLWANVPRIDAKHGKKRIALIGESVARGYFYDPQFTPAVELQTILQSRIGKNAVEVVDLARTDLQSEIKQLARQAILVDPDIVVIFAGNNWTFRWNNPADLSYVDSLLRRDGVVGLKRSVEQQLAQEVCSIVREIATYYQDRNIPLVWIVPEFNLGEWKDPQTNVPYLPNGANWEWIKLLRSAQGSLERGDTVAASDLARKMVALDKGINATGPYILADCSRQRGDGVEARYWLERARDASIWDFSRMISPRAYSVTQTALREVAAKYSNNVIVDLPEIFKEHLAGEVPDRRLFLDFCHLTAEAIKLAMKAAAVSILELLNVDHSSQAPLASQDSVPSLQVRAEASFLAAVHNAHHLQGYDIVHYHCLQSIRDWPKMAQIMLRFMDIQTRVAPMLMCRSSEETSALGSPLIPKYLLRYNNQQLDALLLDAIANVLRTVGIESEANLTRLRCEEHGVAYRERNLLDYYYCSATCQSQELMWVMPRDLEPMLRRTNHYYKSYSDESKFVFVSEESRAVQLSLTCRLHRSSEKREKVSVSVNGEHLGKLAANTEWQTWDIRIPPHLVHRGVNAVGIRWPMPDETSRDAFTQQIGDWIEGPPELFPIYGEIHALTAASGDNLCKEQLGPMPAAVAVEV